MALSKSQIAMRRIIRRMDKGLACRIPVGPNQRDAFGRQLDITPRNYEHLFTAGGKQVFPRVKQYLNGLQTDPVLRKTVAAAIMNYDVRIYEAPDEFWVAVGLSYAKHLMDSTDRLNGHTIHLGQDAYDRHNRVLNIVANTILRTGICEKGGGIICWGVQNGGLMKVAGDLERATTGKNGNWCFATVSHKGGEPTLAGMKVGVAGQVVCVEELVEMLFNPMLEANTDGRDVIVPLRGVSDPQRLITYVGDVAEYEAHLTHRMIGTRTTMDLNTPVEDTLVGTYIYVPNITGGPLLERSAREAEMLGARVDREGVVSRPAQPTAIYDPNESKDVLAALGKRVLQGRLVLMLDPDGDRGSILAYDTATGHAYNVAGTDLLFLLAHNAATFRRPEDGSAPVVVADRRAFIGTRRLANALAQHGYPVGMPTSDAGYNMIHAEIVRANALAGFEQTSHTMFCGLTHRFWGAPKHFDNRPGGDMAGVMLLWMLGLQKYMWEGRNPLEQLNQIHETFDVPHTDKFELKPMLPADKGLAKIHIKDGLRSAARDIFGGQPGFDVFNGDTGVVVHCTTRDWAVMARHSKSGSGFTVSGEYLRGTSAEVIDMLRDAAWVLMLRGAESGRLLLNDADPMLADFELLPKDEATRGMMARDYEENGIIAAVLESARRSV